MHEYETMYLFFNGFLNTHMMRRNFCWLRRVESERRVGDSWVRNEEERVSSNIHPHLRLNYPDNIIFSCANFGGKLWEMLDSRRRFLLLSGNSFFNVFFTYFGVSKLPTSWKLFHQHWSCLFTSTRNFVSRGKIVWPATSTCHLGNVCNDDGVLACTINDLKNLFLDLYLK